MLGHGEDLEVLRENWRTIGSEALRSVRCYEKCENFITEDHFLPGFSQIQTTTRMTFAKFPARRYLNLFTKNEKITCFKIINNFRFLVSSSFS